MLRIGLSAPGEESRPLPGLPFWMTRLMNARGVRTEEEARRFLHPAMDQLLPPASLHDMEKAAALIHRAARDKTSAVIYGDYDVDGVSASAILWEALGVLGMEREVYIPDRHQEGYGLNLPAVEQLGKKFGLLITVDCGITSVQEVKRARELGMQVIVTDHHRHGEALPPADAVISPLLGDYPFPGLCGAGVAWKLAQALVGERAEEWMDIAALATVADMVPLLEENRVITALGLKKLSATRRPGLRALMARAGLEGEISSDQVAFGIAPRINACGRMASARIALEMLLTRDRARAEELALQIEGLNQERKDQENKVLTEALDQAARMDLVKTKAIVVSGEGWNSGVVGLAAGRVAEKYAYPTVALSREGEKCVGSARSAGDVDIHLALSQCADLFERFGGHKQAAGLTMRAAYLEVFAKRLSEAVEAQTGGRAALPSILCDGELRLQDVTEETAAWLKRLEPFGMGNPAPRFLCENVEPLSFRAVGAEGRHLKCTLRQADDLREGIFFGGGAWAGKETGRFRMAMFPTVNVFRGRVSPECRLYGLELMPETLPEQPEREALSFFSEETGGGCSPRLDEEALKNWMAGDQGTLLVCRCLKTALALLKKYPRADFCLERAEDSRAYHTILLYGSARGVFAPYRHVALCDGDFGEGAAYAAACPGAEIGALDETASMRELLRRSFADRDQVRGVYVALRRCEPRDMEDLCWQTGLTMAQAAFALRVLHQIGLVDFSLSPFRAEKRPMVRRGPEESPLFCRSGQAKEEADGVFKL